MEKPLIEIDLTKYPQTIQYGQLTETLKKIAAGPIIAEQVSSLHKIAPKVEDNSREEVELMLFPIHLRHEHAPQFPQKFDNYVESEMDLFSASAGELALFRPPFKLLWNYLFSGLRIIVLDKDLARENPQKFAILEDRYYWLPPFRIRHYLLADLDQLMEIRKLRPKPSFILIRTPKVKTLETIDRSQSEIKHEALLDKEKQNYKGFVGVNDTTNAGYRI